MLYFKAIADGTTSYGTINSKLTNFMSRGTVTRKGKSVAIDIIDTDSILAMVKEALPTATNIRVSPYPFPGTENFDAQYQEGKIAFASGNSRGEVFCALPLKSPEAYVLRFLVEMLSPDGIDQMNIEDIAFNTDLPPLDADLRDNLNTQVTDTYSQYLRVNNERVSPEETDTWPIKLQAARDYKSDKPSALFLASLAKDGKYASTDEAASVVAAMILDKNRQSMITISKAETFRSKATDYIETAPYSEIFNNGVSKIMEFKTSILDA